MASFPSYKFYQDFISKLTELRVASIDVDFQGSGDSGEVEGVSFYNSDAKPLEIGDTVMPWAVEESSWSVNEAGKGQWTRFTKPKDMSLRDIVEDITMGLSDLYSYDWWNNDGGFGTVEITLEDGELKLNAEFNIRYTEVNTYHEEPTIAQLINVEKEGN
jgi:hypothetical protein